MVFGSILLSLSLTAIVGSNKLLVLELNCTVEDESDTLVGGCLGDRDTGGFSLLISL